VDTLLFDWQLPVAMPGQTPVYPQAAQAVVSKKYFTFSKN
jgi:hypothetical protein